MTGNSTNPAGPLWPALPGAGRHTPHLFLHIQKTAGSSLRNRLCTFYPADEQALVYPAHAGMTIAAFMTMAPEQRQHLRLVMGHLFFGLHPLLPASTRYIAFLREPLARLRSHIRQHLRFGSRFFHENQEISLTQAVNEGLSEEFDNLQLRMIAGASSADVPLGAISEAHLRQAVANMVTRFSFVGLTEELGTDWPRLLHYLGLPAMPLQRDNVSPRDNEAAKAVFAAIDWERVTARHIYETALYGFVRQQHAAFAAAPA